MDDRALLEAAARAAGIDLQHKTMFGGDLEPGYYDYSNGKPEWLWWNPLTDDGDALRLAVKLDMIDERQWKAPITGAIYDECNGDWYAATRRAIVRAAAQLAGSKSAEREGE
jgi:hypothetical protein